MNSRNIPLDRQDSLPFENQLFPSLFDPDLINKNNTGDINVEDTGTLNKDFKAIRPIRKDVFRETIKEWWVGRVTGINKEEKFFAAHLKDTKLVESVAEFDFDSVFEDDDQLREFLYPGAEFAFFILIRHGKGSPETVSRIEFSSPYIWKNGDDKKADQVYKRLFPNG